MIEIFCDGASNGKSDSPGGFGYVVVNDGKLIGCGFGFQHGTTNNIMELQAALEGLKHVKGLGLRNVTLISDSKYALGMVGGTLSAVANADLCKEILKLAKEIGVTTRWIKGHGKGGTGDTIDSFWNSWSDALAGAGKAGCGL